MADEYAMIEYKCCTPWCYGRVELAIPLALIAPDGTPPARKPECLECRMETQWKDYNEYDARYGG